VGGTGSRPVPPGRADVAPDGSAPAAPGAAGTDPTERRTGTLAWTGADVFVPALLAAALLASGALLLARRGRHRRHRD